MSYAGLEMMSSTAEAHLGGNVREGDPFGFSPKAWRYVLDRFAVVSILDLGSGLGYSAKWFHDLGKQVIAVDGFSENIQRAVFPTVRCDLEKGPVECVVDLTHCLEVAEHIEEQFLDNLLQSMACGKFILMTHAEPGQGGHHHVNERPAEYWIDHMKRFNCELLLEDTNRVRSLARVDGARYLARTGLMFSNKAR